MRARGAIGPLADVRRRLLRRMQDAAAYLVFGEPCGAICEPVYGTEPVALVRKVRTGPFMTRLEAVGASTGRPVEWDCPVRLAFGLRPGDELVLEGRVEIRETGMRRVVTGRPKRTRTNMRGG